MQWLFVVTPSRPEMLTEGPTSDEGAAVGRHFEYWRGLVENGQGLMVGRTQTSSPDTMGLAVFRSDTEAEARKIAEEDPAVQAGVFLMRLYPYHVALLGEPGPFRPS